MRQRDKIKFCKHCGAEIEFKTNKCTGCGKQYFKLFNKHSFMYYIRYVIMIILMIGNVLFISLYVNEKDYAKELADECWEKTLEISSLKKEINSKAKSFSNNKNSYGQNYVNGSNNVPNHSTNNNILYATENSAEPTCDYPTCNNIPCSGGYYCSIHECLKAGCHNARANDLCSYCFIHKCAMPSCNLGQAYNSVYCSMHKD